jgi:hypothetical protein
MGLHERFEMKRIDHSQAYSFNGACTNQAEGYSAACAVPRSAFATISLARIWFATLRKAHGEKIIAARQTANR